MRDLTGFRAAVREHRRAAGRTQQQLACAIGLHPHVLSHKLNGRGNTVLTAPEVIGIATALAGWGALVTRADVQALLELMDVPPHAVSASAWAAPPLSGLRAPEADRPGGGRPRPRAPAEVRPGPAEPGAGLSLPPLPASATALIGRQRERSAVVAALAASRLVTLTGTGGAGKTRLALEVATEVAGRFTGGAACVDLAPVSEPALLATAIATALGLEPPAAGAADEALAGALSGRQLLLVLDNLEQLLESAPTLGRMLAAAPGLRILATSRIALGLHGEHALRVPPLSLPGPGVGARDSEAVQLFIARAQEACPGFAPGPAELAAIGEICAAVDGLPLAIELAARWVRLYPPQALLPLLSSRLILLTGGPRDRPHRQQTLRASLDWSHALLPAPAQALFAALGVFAGPFDASAAAAVNAAATPAERMTEALAALGEHSLLEVMPGDPPRFRLLQTIREYALARLAETSEADRVHQRYYLPLAIRTPLDWAQRQIAPGTRAPVSTCASF